MRVTKEPGRRIAIKPFGQAVLTALSQCQQEGFGGWCISRIGCNRAFVVRLLQALLLILHFLKLLNDIRIFSTALEFCSSLTLGDKNPLIQIA